MKNVKTIDIYIQLVTIKTLFAQKLKILCLLANMTDIYIKVQLGLQNKI